MDLLKGWIGPRVCQALSEALEWKARGSPVNEGGQQVNFEDDGNSLRVRSSKKELVQICKIEDFARPVQLWLSDTQTMLKVVIASAAVDKFESEQRRRVTEGTLGAVIQIIDYEIVAQHHGPRRTKITMLIKSFKHIGSDGSAPFGTPCSIECQAPIAELLEKLQSLRAQEHTMSQPPAALKPAREYAASQSQTNSVSSADDHLDRTQSNFATQAPRLPSRKRLREGSLKPNGNELGAIDGADSGRLQDVTDGNKMNSRALYLGDAPEGVSEGAIPNKERQASSTSEGLYDKVSFGGHSNANSPERDKSETAAKKAIEPPIAKKANELLSLLARSNDSAKPGAPHPQGLVQQIPQSKPRLQDQLPSPPAVARVVSPVESQLQKQELSPINLIPEPRTKSPVSPVKGSRVIKPDQKILTSPSLTHKAAHRPHKTSTRIRGVEIRIPKTQRDLLDRNDSWHPPEPGHRAPTANIPISILQDLTDHAERQANVRPESLQALSSPSGSIKSNEDENGSSNSDELIPSADWPASSPERVVLPPDSSLDATRSPEGEAPDHTSTAGSEPRLTTEVQSDSLARHQRDLSGSPSTSSDMLTRAAKRKSDRRTQSFKASAPSCDQSSFSYPIGQRGERRSRRLNPGVTGVSHKAQGTSKRRPSASTHNSGNAEHLSNEVLPEAICQKKAFDASSATRNQSKLNFPNHVDRSPRSFQHLNTANASEDDTQPLCQSLFSNINAFDWPSLGTTDLHSHIPENCGTAFESRNIALGSPLKVKLNDSTNSLMSSKVAENHVAQIPRRDLSPNVSSILAQNRNVDPDPYAGARQSDSDSDLETSIPHGLNEANDISSAMQFTQMNNTATQLDQPDVEVSRTPYATTTDFSLESAPSSASPTPVRNHYSRDTVGLGGRHSSPAVNTGSPQAPNGKHSFSRLQNKVGMDQAISSVEETVLPLGTLPDAIRMSDRSMLPPNAGTISKSELKRKASEPVILSPNVTKRRKALTKGRATSEVGMKTLNVDPTKIGRQHRQDFFAGRRSSISHIKDGGKNAADDLNALKSASSKSSPNLIGNIGEYQMIPGTMETPGNPDEAFQEQHNREDGDSAPRMHDVLPEPPHHLRTKEVIDETRLEGTSSQNDCSLSALSSTEEHGVAANGLPSVFINATTNLLEPQDASQEARHPTFSTLSWPPIVTSFHPQSPLDGATGAEGQSTVPDTSLSAKELAAGHLDLNRTDQEIPEAATFEKEIQQSRQPSNVFELFKATYPDYTGNCSHFAAICKQIGLLYQEERMEHPSLWDDFIVRHKTDYLQYQIQCNEEAMNPDPYERFYRNKVSRAKYISPDGPIATPISISEYLPSEPAARGGIEGTEVASGKRSVKKKVPPSDAAQDKPGSKEAPEMLSPINGHISSTDRRSGNVTESVYTEEKHSNVPKQASRNASTSQAATLNIKRDVNLSRRQSSSPTVLAKPTKISEESSASKPQPEKEVINLSSDSNSDPDDRSAAKDKPATTELPKPKQVKQSLPWNSSSNYDLRTVRTSTRKGVAMASSSIQKTRATPSASASKDVNSKSTTTVSVSAEKKSITRPAKQVKTQSWVTDKHSPFNAFTRNYEAITPGKGNSYAQQQPQQGSDSTRTRGRKEKLKPIDPFELEI